MKKKIKKTLSEIKRLMINSLEEPDRRGVLNGEYVCHEDFFDTPPIGFDDQFVVCGDEEQTFLVLIQHVDTKKVTPAEIQKITKNREGVYQDEDGHIHIPRPKKPWQK